MKKPWFSMGKALATDEERILVLREFLRDNLAYIMSGMALAAAIVGAWQWWLWDGRQADYQAATAYVEHLMVKQDLEDALDKGLAYDELDAEKIAEANELLDRFKTKHNETAYSTLAHLNQAAWLNKAKRLDDVIEVLEWTVARPLQQSVHQLAIARLARVLIEAGKGQRAIQALNSVIPSRPMNIIFGEVRGDAHYSLKQYPQAAIAYREAYNASPQKPLFLRLKLIEVAQHLPDDDQ